jgi:hypothetical protein
VEGGGGVVGENRLVPAGLDRREEAAFPCEVPVAHGVNAPIKGVEPPAAHANLDLAVAQAAREQVLQRYEPPLAGGEVCDEEIRRRGELSTYAVCF